MYGGSGMRPARAFGGARDAGAKAPLIVVANVPGDDDFRHAASVSALAALGGLWQPLEAREARGEGICEPLERVGLALIGDGGELAPLDEDVIRWISAVEGGRRVARDLCGTEPERMAAPGFASYCKTAFANLRVELSVLEDQDKIKSEYPLVAAVARASMPVERHQPRIVRLTYNPEGRREAHPALRGQGRDL